MPTPRKSYSPPTVDSGESIGARLRRRDPDDVLIVTADGEQVTARQSLDRSAAMALELVAAGIRPGDRVAVLHDLSPEALMLWWALGRLGAVYLPLNPSWTRRLAGRVVADRRPVVLLAEPRHRTLAEQAAGGTAARVLDAASLRGAGTATAFVDSPTGPLDDCCIVHNSGRPGIDHGVRGSWRQFSVMAANMSAMHPQGRVLVAGAPCFMGVLLTVYGAVLAGSAVALLPGLSSETFWPAVRRAGVTSAAMLNPTVADLLARSPADDRDHPLRLMAGSTAESERNAEAGRRFGVHWVCGLGKTEVCGAVGTGIDPAAAEGVGKVRPPFIGRIVQPATGEVVPRGESGELVLRCEVEGGLPAGYADDPQATAELWRDGWLHTGWHLREDEAGCLHPVGDNSTHPIVVKRAGYLFAADLEREIVAVTRGVGATRVVSRPGADELADPVVIAWVTREHAGAPLDRGTVAADLRDGLPAHLVPDLVVAVTDLPDHPEDEPVPAYTWRIGPA